MKIHGNIEGNVWNPLPRWKIFYFHEWKFMATLKDQHIDWFGSFCPNFHEWKFMATLKDLFPFLPYPDDLNFHEWKFMATLKDLCVECFPAWCQIFPWMKIHGNIEGRLSAMTMRRALWISMNENSWQHWRFPNLAFIGSPEADFHEWKFMATLKEMLPPSYPTIPERNFHEWKFMATLKAFPVQLSFAHSDPFPWMKIHGNIEGTWRSRMALFTRLISMNENSWQHWRLDYVWNGIKTYVQFPWMKIHGNIEGITSRGSIRCRHWLFPWMKIHGNIEGIIGSPTTAGG